MREAHQIPEETESLPHVWTTLTRTNNHIEFESDTHNVLISITPQRGKIFKRTRQGQHITGYQIRLKQDWFATEPLGDKDVSTTVVTFQEAMTSAQRFMREFNQKRGIADSDHGGELAVSFGEDIAQELLTTEASTEGFTDVAGYSDELLLEILDEAVGDAVQLVAHRQQGTPTEIYRGDGLDPPDEWPHDVFGYFSIDKGAVETIFSNGNVDYYVIDIGEFRLFRCIAGATGETIVMLDDDAPVTPQSFERSIGHVTEHRWQ